MNDTSLLVEQYTQFLKRKIIGNLFDWCKYLPSD